MSADRPHVSVVVNAHREGRLAHRSVRSARVCLEDAAEHGIRCELVAILDRPDAATAEYFEENRRHFSLVEQTDFGDPGLARNRGAELARGDWVAFLDADDLFSRGWLTKAYETATGSGESDVVVHPEFNLWFGSDFWLVPQVSWPGGDWSALDMLGENAWSTLCFCPRELVARDVPFSASDEGNGFGYEDWHWHCQTMARRVPHRVAPGTVHFIRRKETGSRLGGHKAGGCLIRPTRLFDDEMSDLWTDDSPATPSGALQGLNPLNARILHRLAERMPPRVREAAFILLGELRRALRPTPRLADWLREEWQKIHAVEPQLYPSRSSLRAMRVRPTPRSALGRHFPRISQLFGPTAEHVFLWPRSEKGGADLAALNYLRSIAEESPNAGIVCILTEHADHPWRSRLPDRVRVVELGRELCDFTRHQQVTLLARLLLQKCPKVIQLINSPTGYELFIRYGKQLASQSQLVVALFDMDFDAAGQPTGYAVDPFSKCADIVSGVVSDNGRMLDFLKTTYGVPEDKCQTLCNPARQVETSARAE